MTKLNITDNALRVLERRYLKRDEAGKVLEEAEDMFRRVARNIAQADKLYDEKADLKVTEDEFFELMTSLKFLPNSPTLMNAGRELQQLSACFVLPIEDSMESIFETIKQTALIHKSGGGTGFSFSRIRPSNDVVKSTKGVSSGPVSFMAVFDAATETIKQGGTRRGANMGILEVTHPDIENFIVCKKDNDKINNFNISVAITDGFMDALKDDSEYDIINPRSGKPIRKLKARKIFDSIVKGAWTNGDPGLIFIDRINAENPTPHVGRIESTNPCGEQPLLPYESCNLGSINLLNMLKFDEGGNWVIDADLLTDVVRKAVHFLDNVIDMNNYPIEQIGQMTRSNRKIGLGIMGFSDMLYRMGISYNSEKALETAEYVMKVVFEKSREMSMELAEKRGAFPNYEGSVFDKHIDGRPIRNATTTTIAPTGTISIIGSCSSGIEPAFALAYVRHVMDDDELAEINSVFKTVAEDQGFYSDELMKEIAGCGSCQHIEEIPEEVRKIFVTSHDIEPEWHIRMQAAFQKYTDNAVSKTINFPNSATVEDVEKAYLMSYDMGCKGITIYRDGSRDVQVLTVGTDKKAQSKSYGDTVPVVVQAGMVVEPRERPSITSGSTLKMKTGCGNLYVTINQDEIGICEVFTQMGKSGGCAAAQSEAISRLVSLALRSNIDAEQVVKHLKGIRCPKPSFSSDGRVNSCPDAMGRTLEKFLNQKMPNYGVGKMPAGNGNNGNSSFSISDLGVFPECPECGSVLEPVEGCVKCRICGYSEC